ncbi:SpoIIE family protein phosphatase [Actinomadura nitritigenes]|uniref:SpoIIE family protein phosphatase n=1 Tax=Actinomadura nitritigenes TaxID=134602 RepID=A0ABS3R5P9_9ACTN|nr:GAF domain-containing SpoIIE family protein phosphatase [Actinomadura nitritigenes]MBO2441362.1 SpoIIE family protein phosphatase [Actinomadura nitritigenes]
MVFEAVRDAGAHAGALYVLAPDEETLALEVLVGLPGEVAALWRRVALTHPLPATDAVRARQLIQVDGPEELSRRYPRAALVFPYRFGLVAAPVTHDGIVHGALLLLWPGARHDFLTPPVRERVGAACDLLGTVLHCTPAADRAFEPAPEPRVMAIPSSGAEPAEGEAVRFAERFPEGGVSLDLNGRVAFATRTAAALLGKDSVDLVGTLPWESLPWLNDPVCEDRYRAAVIGRQPSSFTAMRPDGQWLDFGLFPDDTGISLRIAPAQAPAVAQARSPAGAPPLRLGALHHLLHLAGALTEAVSVRDVVDLVADTVLPAFGAQALAMAVAEGGRLRVIGHRGYTPRVVERFDGTPLTFPSPAARALAEGTAGFFADRADLERAYPARARQYDGMAAWAYLPLIASGRPIGTWILAYDHPHTIGAEDRATLTALSGLIAQALDRARLYDTEHALAQGLQKELLPHALPEVSGLDVAARYLPAAQGVDIGGDFYDVIRLDDRTVAAVIGDVQGHNIAAAALMGQVRTAIHAHAAAGAPPDQVLARTNRLLADLQTDLFTSCLYTRIDLGANTACFASAGHLPPLLHEPDGTATVLDLDPGLLLGITADTTYRSHEVPLPPRAVLALYTDGLVEVPGEDIASGIDKLAEILDRGARCSLDTIADRLTAAAGDVGDRADDIALLLLRPHE